jgi:hypothetical protein
MRAADTAPDGESPVDRAVLAIAEEVGVIAKARTAPDEIGGFKFRGIEDALNALHPLLVKHRLNIWPRLVQTQAEAVGKRRLVTTDVEYRFRCDGHEEIIGPFPGEGADSQDKGASKGMSAAWKQMAFQVFSIPVADSSVDSEAYNASDDREPTTEELWAAADEQVHQAAEKQQDRLDHLPADLANAVLHRMTQRVNLQDGQVTGVRDLGPGWLAQWGRVLDRAWEKAEQQQAAT